MTRTRKMFWTMLALSSSVPALADAQQSSYPPPVSGEIQLYSRPLEEEQAAPALPETPRRLPDADTQPIPKLRYEDLPPEPPPVSAPPPAPKTRYEEPPQPTTQALPPPDLGEEAASSDWSPSDNLLAIQHYRGIPYVSGGVGEGERAELNALSSRFNLRLLFAMQGSGSYVADVRVNVLDGRGGLALTAQSKGPWFLIDLPPGTYTVEAETMGQAQRQTARLDGARQTRLNFYWR